MPQIYENTYVDPRITVAPTLANLKLQEGGSVAGNYALAALLGGTAAFDQAMLWYAWDPALTTAGNDTTIVQPTAIVGALPGRWRKV